MAAFTAACWAGERAWNPGVAAATEGATDTGETGEIATGAGAGAGAEEPDELPLEPLLDDPGP